MSASGASPLSHHHLLRSLGVGGMGEVFLAHDTDLDRQVAIKILSPELARDEKQRTRFRNEARAASALVHPNICVVHEVGETGDGRPFVVMEYITGKTLEQVAHERRLRIREVLNLGIEAAEALAMAHDHGIIHRDIKPANIMLDARGQVKVLDFGLAKRFGEPDQGGDAAALGQTQAGTLIGTPCYMSPEQAMGQDLDARADIFSLGAVLYELLAGEKAFACRTLGEAINSVIHAQPKPLELENPLFSPALDNIIFKCLEKDREKRYASAAALGEDLVRLKQLTEHATISTQSVLPVVQAPSGTTHPRPTGLWQRIPAFMRKPASLAGAAATVILVVTGTWAMVHYGLPQRLGGTGTNAARRGAPAKQKSIAVLPFANYSAEEDTEYLSDGLTEEITSALSRVQGLKVAARNSAFVFKGKHDDIRAMGKALRVNTLLSGSVRKSGNQLRVTANLISAADGFQLWSETFNRPIDDLLKVEEEIADRIARRMDTGAATVKARKLPSADGHRLYLQARLSWNKRTESGLTNAIVLFSRALEKDPAYAEAHAGLAAAYFILPNYASVRRSHFVPLARAAAKRALELDPACAEAHAVLGQVQWTSQDLKGAEQHFRRALELDPSYATAHHWYGLFLTVHGRAKEGFPELQSAAALDPLSPVICTSISEWHYLSGNVDDAIQECRNVIAAFPDFPIGRVMLSYALIKKGLFAEAVEQLELARNMEPEKPLAYLDVKAYALARAGRDPEARNILAVFEQARRDGKSVDAPLSLIYVGLREYDAAVDAFERMAAAEGLEDVILCDPCFKELHALPRFQLLVKKAGLTLQ